MCVHIFTHIHISIFICIYMYNVEEVAEHLGHAVHQLWPAERRRPHMPCELPNKPTSQGYLAHTRVSVCLRDREIVCV